MRHLFRTLISALVVPAGLVIAAPTVAGISWSITPAITSAAASATIGNGPFQAGALGLILFDGALSSIDMVLV